MKKLLAIALMFVFLGALAVGCGGKDTKSTPAPAKPDPAKPG